MSRVRYSREPAPTSTAIDDCGSTHVRYQHALIPRVLEVSCPRCGQRAGAELSSSDPSRRLAEFGRHDLGWRVTCGGCAYRARDTRCDDLPPLYWRFDAGGTRLWGWNRDHLVLLERILDNDWSAGHPYEFLTAHVRGEWLQRAARKALSKAIDREFASTGAKQDRAALSRVDPI